MYLKMYLTNLLELIKKKKRVPVTCHSSQLKHGLSVVRLTGIVVHFNLRRGLNKKFEPLSSILEERPMIFVQNNNEVKNGISSLTERVVLPAFFVQTFLLIQLWSPFLRAPLRRVKNCGNWTTVSNKFILETLLQSLFQSLTFLEPVGSAKCSALSSQAANLAWQSCSCFLQMGNLEPQMEPHAVNCRMEMRSERYSRRDYLGSCRRFAVAFVQPLG